MLSLYVCMYDMYVCCVWMLFMYGRMYVCDVMLRMCDRLCTYVVYKYCVCMRVCIVCGLCVHIMYVCYVWYVYYVCVVYVCMLCMYAMH